MNQAEWTQFVESGVGSLTEKQRRTIRLVNIDGYTLQEAANAQGETLANTRNYYYRGLKALRAFLNRSPQVVDSGEKLRWLDPSGALRYD